MTSDSHLFRDRPGEGLLPLYEAKMIHQFDHRWATYDKLPSPSGRGVGGEGNSRDCTPAEKSDPGYAPLPRYWVAEREVLARIAGVPRGVANAWLSGDGKKLTAEVGLWLIGNLRASVGDGRFLNDAEKLNPELARAAREAKTRWEKAKTDAEAFPMPEALFEQLGKTRGEAALIELFDEWMDRLSPRWLMGWRDICRSTDERTVIASVVPRVGVGHTMPLMLPSSGTPRQKAALLGNLDSLSLDYVARQKVGGTHLTYGFLRQFPILPPERYTEADLAFIVPRVLELTYTAHDLRPWAEDITRPCGAVPARPFRDGRSPGNVSAGHISLPPHPFPWNPERRTILRAELDAYYARLYGLTRDELRYILDPADCLGSDYPSETFRVLKNNEMREFGEYRTRRLVLDAWDTLDLPHLGLNMKNKLLGDTNHDTISGVI